ncbi:MAG: UDP-N-acetylenolpyruvoylglucosamine reductase [Robiginitomaculum sp.]|nr:MAG: UDP-N-acetylenolpyruvoylglucosamine reductase [Robiginitomaculum sp.]
MAFPSLLHRLPNVRGSLRENVPLGPYTWFRVGGAAQVFFMPKDEADLALFLPQVPSDILVQILGVASNTLVRDGGVPGITIRLGPSFAKVEAVQDNCLRVGAACLDAVVAKKAAQAGLAGLEFYAGIPGTIGGALRMNAGCYGVETKDVLVEVIALDRRGRRQIMDAAEMGYSYRHCSAPADLIFVEALYKGAPDTPEAVTARMAEITQNRANSQPIKEKTGGSTFKNPDPVISDGRGAWQVIDAAGGRGFKVGGAQMSEKHCNFMINTGTATADDLEVLGETIRAMVKETQDVELHWEIRRIGLKGEEGGNHE